MAGGGISEGPTPWWQTSPQMGAARTNLEASAPPGYAYDPVQMQYQRTPQSAGSNVAAFESAALGGIPSLNGLSGGASASAGAFGVPAAGGASGGPVAGGSGVAPMQMPDMKASNDAIFAQAKDKVGQLSRASLDSLAGEMGSQGMLGSGAQAQATRDTIANNAENLGQVTRDSATQNANTALDVAKTNYAGGLTQRGQDIQAQEANAQLAIAQQKQQYDLLSLMLSGLGKAPGGSQYSSPALLY